MKNSGNLFKTIIAEIKEMEDMGMIYLILLSIGLFVVDILHLCFHFHFPEFLRIVYTYSYIISSTYFINRFGKKKRLEKEKLEQIENIIRELRSFGGEEWEMLYKFVQPGECKITINSKEERITAKILTYRYDFLKIIENVLWISVEGQEILRKAYGNYELRTKTF